MAAPLQLTPTALAALRIPATPVPATAALLKALVGQTLEATLTSTQADGLHLRLADGRELVAKGSLPFPEGSVLALRALPLPGGAGLRLQLLRATAPPAPTLLHPLTHGEAGALLARLQTLAPALEPLAALLRTLTQAGATAPEQPEAWGAWLKEAMKALADPAASPEEAPFHRLQAKESTGLFELPLPWAASEPLRLWVEADQDPSAEPGGRDAVHRVFLSVPFSTLGDVRVGLEQRTAGLRVRLWLRDPAQLASSQKALEAELATLGRPVDLQILPLPDPAPDLRAMAGGVGLSALG
jgi:hypothetical protein